MRTNIFTLRNLFFIGFIAIIIYAVVDGIRSNSPWGFVMAMCSMVAFVYSIQLSRKLAKLQEEEEEEQY
ncbi:MAG: hypothetical protein ABI581_15400 [Sediminibacterium sp.]